MRECLARLGWPEILGLCVLVIVLCGSRHVPEIMRGFTGNFRDAALDAFTTRGRTRQVWSSDLQIEIQRPPKFSLKLWLAQGLGTGRAPFAPGTFGSALGLGWFALLLWPGSVWVFGIGLLGSVALSVWLCGAAEKDLHQKDPSSVVLDEIVAMPLCFVGWIWVYISNHQAIPSPLYFFDKETWLLTLGTFLLFRAFDVLKPWPIRQSQALPGGWGVTVDDLLAGTCTAVIAALLAANFLA